jgi:hypothetical protein
VGGFRCADRRRWASTSVSVQSEVNTKLPRPAPVARAGETRRGLRRRRDARRRIPRRRFFPCDPLRLPRRSLGVAPARANARFEAAFAAGAPPGSRVRGPRQRRAAVFAPPGGDWVRICKDPSAAGEHAVTGKRIEPLAPAASNAGSPHRSRWFKHLQRRAGRAARWRRAMCWPADDAGRGVRDEPASDPDLFQHDRGRGGAGASARNAACAAPPAYVEEWIVSIAYPGRMLDAASWSRSPRGLEQHFAGRKRESKTSSGPAPPRGTARSSRPRPAGFAVRITETRWFATSTTRFRTPLEERTRWSGGC